MSRGKKGSLGEEECLQARLKNCSRVAMENSFRLWELMMFMFGYGLCHYSDYVKLFYVVVFALFNCVILWLPGSDDVHTDADWLSFMQVCHCHPPYLDSPVCLLVSWHTCPGELAADIIVLLTWSVGRWKFRLTHWVFSAKTGVHSFSFSILVNSGSVGRSHMRPMVTVDFPHKCTAVH